MSGWKSARGQRRKPRVPLIQQRRQARRPKPKSSNNTGPSWSLQRTVLEPNRPHAYFDGVTSSSHSPDYQHAPWAVKVPYQGFVLALAHDRDSGEGAIWTRPLGSGRIIVSGYGSLFTNRALGLGDNAQLLANIVGANVDEGGAVLFDDVHQGLGATYDPDKFYRDSRLYITIGVLVALSAHLGARLRRSCVHHDPSRARRLAKRC